MSCSNIPPYILQELSDITETVNYPIKNIQRIKYTCFDISKTLIAFGATSGGIYVFNRWPCEFVQLIPSKDGPITRLAISADEKHIGFANGKGFVIVTACEQTLSGYSTTSSKEHLGNEVTAMVWSKNVLFTGDDTGKVSVLQLQNFIAKRMFQSSSQMIMSLDSRISQLDAKDCMLLVSTLTRCYICNTVQEQYRQIGQKLRDGEFGACFAYIEKPLTNGSVETTQHDFTDIKKYNIVDDDTRFTVGEEFSNTAIYCARPSSRLWEASVDGMVRRTHQFKQVLSKQHVKIITKENYESQKYNLDDARNDNGQAVNFSKVYSMNDAIFSYSKNSLFFLNLQDVDNTVWFNEYNDIAECRVFKDMVYIRLSNSSLISLRFTKIDKFLVKCYKDEKFGLCAEMCALFKEYLLSHNSSPKLHILVGLRDNLQNNGLLKSIEDILENFERLKAADVTQMKSGIYLVDNLYAQSILDDDVKFKNDENLFGPLPPEALNTLKGLGVTVSDKLNTSKRILKEKWEDFEEKMKHLSIDKQEVSEIRQIHDDSFPKWIPRDDFKSEETVTTDSNIIFNKSSQNQISIEDNNSMEKNKVCKMLYQYSRLSLVNKEPESDLNSIIDSYSNDITQIHDLILSLEKYCVSINALEESRLVPHNIFLTYLDKAENKTELINSIINDEVLYKYFVDSCIAVNINQKHSNIGCECGFPLPYIRTSQMPIFSELIDDFIEQQWLSQTKEQCYEMCKKMPYLWRKILYLRRNEDLIHVLRILLQMLDESLLHSFLPQFTLETWERAIQLYATLYANICLNCDKKFNHISVKDTLSWDHLGSMIIKSVGGKNAIKVMQKHVNLIERGALTIKFYHTCLLVYLYEKYDGTIIIPLVDTIYSAYDFEESRTEIQKLLLQSSNGTIKNTALPLTVAGTSPYWGLKKLYEDNSPFKEGNLLNDILLAMAINDIIDCALCGLPLQNEVLIQDGGLWVFKCGHTFHGACLNLNKIKLCPSCTIK
uniref:Pink n=1 Tax=Limenitis arthemis astyanax TaxID=324813 RepID=A0A6B9UPZ1_LIMAT|nr:pink [Limenitis arthemis astyanax]